MVMKFETIQLKIFSNAEDGELKKILESGEVIFQNDIVSHCLEELFDITHPQLKPDNSAYAKTKASFLKSWSNKKKKEDIGVWVYYSWSKSLIHFPPEDMYIALRTSRNRNLITPEEQKIFQNKCVGIAGMSVGSNILNTLVLIGGPRHLKIADLDSISVPNLNRLMAPVSAVGVNKGVYFARRCLEVDPFLKIDVYSKGLGVGNFKSFFEEPKLDLFIEEMDNPYLKIESRKVARNLGIPVIMAADNGDGALIDVERFDLEPDRPLLHRDP